MFLLLLTTFLMVKTMSKYRYETPLTIILFFTIISIISSCFSNENNGDTSTIEFKVENLIIEINLDEK